MGPEPVFDNVTVLAVLVVPRTWEEKETAVGVSVAMGAVPVPERTIDCVGPALPESSERTIDPLIDPVAVGV
jgi:hypothetical protein